MISKILFTSLLGLIILVNNIYTLDNGLARTPPMGFMTWQRFRCNVDCVNDPENCISEHLVREMAHLMVSDGYLAAGYEYIIIDDCWLSHKRDPETNELLPDPKRFPSGIRKLADYIHSKGLKFGIYEDYGTLTCGGFPGSINNLELDAITFAKWTVDYLKLDGCYADVSQMDAGYPEMGYFLNKTNRPIVYSCSWPAYQNFAKINPNYTRIAEYCNLWRNYDDIDDSWDSVYTITEWFASKQDELALIHGPGQWNDPDMLIIGNYGLSDNQARAQMALWAMMSAPLLMSVDLRVIKPWHKEILQNKNLIGINQDELGTFGKRILTINNIEIWSKTMSKDRTAFVFLNHQPYGTPAKSQVDLKNLGLILPKYSFYEMFSGDLIGHYSYKDLFKCTIDPSGSVYAFWAEPVKSKLTEKLKSHINEI